jgi:hypothetical protein
MEQVLHKHHIIPRHAGGTDDPSNIVELTVEEHAEAHRLLYEQYGRREDYLAWRGLAGLIGKDEMIKEKCSLNSSRPGELNTFYSKKHSEESKRKISEKKKGVSTKQPPKTPEWKKKLSDARRAFAQKYTFQHKDGSVFVGSTRELSELTGSNPAETWKLSVGKYKSHKGWKMIDTEQK